MKTNPYQINITWYMGPNGFYTQACDYFFILNKPKQFYEYVQNIVNDEKRLAYAQNEGMYEVIYGVAGYLYCLLYLQKRYQFANVPKEFKIDLTKLVVKVMRLLVVTGVQQFIARKSKQKNIWIKDKLIKIPNKQNFRLYYLCFKQEYIGGAHGIFGILLMLQYGIQMNDQYLQTKEKELREYMLEAILNSLHYFFTRQTSSGNFTAVNREIMDELVQFCHGSPGAITCYIEASKLFNTPWIKKCLAMAAECTWKYGICLKGFGLCHGIQGNGQFILSVYNYTKNEKWLKRALYYGMVSLDITKMKEISRYNGVNRFVVGTPDYPYSLMEGTAGDLHFYADLIDPENAYFPGYEL